MELINEIQNILKKKADIKFLYDKIENNKIDLNNLDLMLKRNNIYKKNYYKIVLRKYWQ